MEGGFVSGIVPTRAARAERSVVCMSVSRRDMLKFAIGAAAAVVVPMEALADGATSPATKYRVRGIYGYKIMSAGDTVNSVQGLVDSGSWVELGNLVSSAKKSSGKLRDLEGALQLFKTGYFADSRPKQRVMATYQSEFVDAVAALEAAAKKQDKSKANRAAAELKNAYDNIIAYAELSPNEFANTEGQAWSSDYDYRRKF
ncbi:hypothetical protein NDN08_001876 [Rhodosorus marinus]|uniref:Photosystem II Psb31 protein domain-containing protein n=1 Tax=Rhodosorus marinus TaxID=101924 RepID=A0AAV8US72_9RHOD|nr:hypothetical protein NDN08_001876 [Rhodosorus marinus]